MKKLCLAMLVFISFQVQALAQLKAPVAELFGGVTYTHQADTNLLGWNAAVSGNFNSWFGIVGDFTGQYSVGDSSGINTHVFSYRGGPRFISRHSDILQPFAQMLIGGVHITGSVPVSGLTISASTNALSVAPGGGVDLVLAPGRVAWRLVQVEYSWLHVGGSGTSADGASSNGVRVATGVVIRF